MHVVNAPLSFKLLFGRLVPAATDWATQCVMSSRVQAFTFKDDGSKPNFAVAYRSTSDIQVVQGKEAASNAAEGYSSTAAKVSSPWVSASVSHKSSHSSASTDTSAKSYTVQSFSYPKATIWVNSFLKLSDSCSAALSAALDSSNSDQEKCQSLSTFFDTYGQLMPLKVVATVCGWKAACAWASASGVGAWARAWV